MKRTIATFLVVQLLSSSLLACSESSKRGNAERLDGATDGLLPSTRDGSNQGFSVDKCQSDTCGAEAAKCGWDAGEPKYLGCLNDCALLGTAYTQCSEGVTALYACASLGEKVDCTTGMGTGCNAEELAVAACLQRLDAGT
jgi:hypothetical protein